MFQITAYRGTQVFHENHTAEEAAAILEADLSGSFKQLQIETTSFESTVLVSKKGKIPVVLSTFINGEEVTRLHYRNDFVGKDGARYD